MSTFRGPRKRSDAPGASRGTSDPMTPDRITAYVSGLLAFACWRRGLSARALVDGAMTPLRDALLGALVLLLGLPIVVALLGMLAAW